MNIKKSVSIILVFFTFITLLSAEVLSYSLFDGRGKYELTITGNDFYKKDNKNIYFKTKVNYSWKSSDETKSDTLWTGDLVTKENGDGSYDSSSTLHMYCDWKREIVGVKKQKGHDDTYISFIRDTTAPRVTMNTDDVCSSDNSYSFDISAEEDQSSTESGFANLYYRIDGGAYTAVNGSSKTITVTGRSNHTVDVYAVDKVNNVSQTYTKHIYLDNTPPSVTINTDTVYSKSNSTSLKVTASDSGSGFEKFCYTIDNGAVQDTSSNPCTIEVKEYGNHTVKVYATDKAGNKSTEYTKYIYLDNTGPSVTVDTDTVYSQASSKSFEVSASDSGSGFDKICYTIDSGDEQKTSTNPYTIEVKNYGNHSVKVYATDKAGNKSKEYTKKIYLDKTEPTITVNTDTVYSQASSESFEVTASDSGSGFEKFCYTIDNGAVQNASSNPCTIEVKNYGNHTVKVYAYDNAGNKSSEYTKYVYLDNTPPTPPIVHNQLDGIWVNYDVTVNADSSSDNGSGIKIYQYKVNSEAWQNGSEVIIQKENYEGINTVYFRTIDKAGNISSEVQTVVKIDITKPVITDKKELNASAFMSDGKQLNENELINKVIKNGVYEPEIQVNLSATDKYVNYNGNVIAYYWYLNQDSQYVQKSELNVFTVSNIKDSEGNTLSEFGQDLNTVTFYVEDEAHNLSDEISYSFMNDNIVPNRPLFDKTTASHKEVHGITDAMCVSDASFDVSTEIVSKYGIRGFEYSLYIVSFDTNNREVSDSRTVYTFTNDEGSETELKDLFIKSDSKTNISEYLKNLPDNSKENDGSYDCYVLSVKTIASNGLQSAAAEYAFRIDTEAPENYINWFSPQVDNKIWYGSSLARLYWMEKRLDADHPHEKTGVSKYEYLIEKRNNSDEELSLADEDVLAEKSFTEIENTSSGYIDIDLGSESGIYDVVMRFTDYAGNIGYSKESIKLDITSPVFQKTIAAELTEKSGNTELVCEWGNIIDQESGLDKIEITVTELEGEKATFVTRKDIKAQDGNIAESLIINDLNIEKSYYVTLLCYDCAGNVDGKTAIARGQNFNSLENLTVLIPYSGSDGNFNFEGNAFLNVAENSISGYQGKVTFNYQNTNYDFDVSEGNLSNFENGVLVFAKGNENTEKSFNVYLNEDKDNKVTSSQLGYDNSKGLLLYQISYDQQLQTDSKTVKFDEGWMGLNSNNSLSTLQNSLSETINIKENFSDLVYSNVTSITFNNGVKELNGDITVAPANINLKNVDGTNDIKVSNVMIDYSKETISATLSENNNVLSLNNINYTVNNGYIENDILVVKESTVNLAIGNNKYKLKANGFKVSLETGKVVDGVKSIKCFDELNNVVLQITDGTTTLLVSSIEITENGDLYVREGLHKILNTNVDNIYIVQNGFNYLDSSIDEVTITYGSFTLVCSDVDVNKDYVLITSGSVKIYDIEYTFNNLKYYPSEEINVKEACVIKNNNTDATFTKDPTNKYQKNNTYKNLKITGRGIEATIVLTMPDDKTWTLNDVLLNSDRSCSYINTNADFKLKYGLYDLSVTDVEFDGSSVLIHKGSVDLDSLSFYSNEKSIKELNFENLKFNYSEEILSGIITDNSLKYVFDEWNMYFDELKLTNNGLLGSGIIKNTKDEEYYIQCGFNQFNVNPNNVVSSGISNTKSDDIFIKNNYLFTLGTSKFEKNKDVYILCSETLQTEVQVYDTVTLTFGKTEIKSDSTIIKKSKSYNQTVTFKTSNDYTVNVTSATLDDKKIMLSGEVKNTKLESSTTFEKDEIVLKSNFWIEASNPNGTIDYVYNGWNVKGTGVHYYYDKVVIDSNIITFKDTEIDLGTLTFNDNKVLVGEVETDQDMSINIITDKSNILATKVSKDGVKIRADIRLPKPFESVSIILDDIYIESDGSYYIKEATDEIEFNIGNLLFGFKDVILGSKGITVGDIKIFIPKGESSRDDIKLKLKGLSFTNEGKIILEGSSVSPFTVFGMTYSINNFSVIESGIYIEGYTVLPESLPGVLSAMKIEVKKFFIDFDGTIHDLDVKAAGDYSIPFNEKWALTFSDVGLEAKDDDWSLVMGSCGLIFPPEYNVDSVSISDVRYTFNENNFDFGTIEAKTSFPLEISGIKLTITDISITSDFTVGLGGKATFDDRFPEFLQNSEINAKLAINKHGNLQDIYISADGLNGKISNELTALELKDGNVVISKASESSNALKISIKGGLVFTDDAPAGMQDVELTIDKFTFDGSIPQITELSASASGFKVNIAQVEIKDLSASIDWDGTSESSIGLGGKIVLPSTMPAGIAGKENNKNITEIVLDSFVINFKGKVTEFSASIRNENGSINAFDALTLTNIYIGINYNQSKSSPEFSVGADMTLDKNKFPEGIGGTKTRVDFVFDGSGVQEAYASYELPKNTKIFNTFICEETKIELSKPKNQNLTFSVSGSLHLSSSLPQGLAGSLITINDFRIDSSGLLLAFDAGAKFSSINIYDAIQFTTPSVNVKQGTDKNFIISIGGGIKLIAASLPEGLKNTSLVIENAQFSTDKNVRPIISATMESAASFTILGGLEISIDKLSINENGFNCGATAKLNYVGPMTGTEIKLSNFAMTWKGDVTDISGGLKSMPIDIAGFKGSIKELYFVKDATCTGGFYIQLDSCKITMPDNMGSMAGKSFAVKNACFKNGKFQGSFEVPDITTEIAGFDLCFKDPTLDFKNKGIGFSSVSLKMPETLKSAKIGLNGVSITASNGLQFSGGSFRLPDFSIGDNVGFTNIYVNFSLDQGKYFIEGSGGLSLAGCGQMSAYLSFTNITRQYPIGLKRAYFSFEATAGKGIPLGTTGLVLSGIRGGLAFGDPVEVPANMRYMFQDEGIRIQLGLTVKDKAGGNLVSMYPDTWIDVQNFSWAFTGKLYVMKGTFNLSAQADAALNRYGFYTGLAFELKVVKGNVEFYVFDESGNVKFSGSGKVQFGLSAGCLVDVSFKICWVPVHIKIPANDHWLGKIGAEFGDFTNRERGFKAWASFSGFGDFGVFVGSSSKLKIGSVSSYSICKPKGAGYGNTGSRTIVNLNSVDYSKTKDENCAKEYGFTIHSKSNPGVTVQDNNDLHASGYRSISSVSDSDSIQAAQNGDSGLDRVVFVFSFAEGDPVFWAESPSGIVYKPGDDNVETVYYDNCVTFMVKSPEAGDWQFKVDNIDEDMYAVDLVTFNREPDLDVVEPSWNRKPADNSIYIEGNVSEPDTAVYVYAAESTESPLIELGELRSDKDGKYSGYVSTENIPDGEYVIGVQVQNYSGELTRTKFSSGSYLIDRSQLSLNKPENFKITEREDNSLYAAWNNVDGKRTEGYYLKLETPEETKIINTGNVEEYSISYFERGTRIKASVCSYDVNGNESQYTDQLEIVIGGEKDSRNKPVVLVSEYEVTAHVGEMLEGKLSVNVPDYQKTDSMNDYLRGKIIQINNMNLVEDKYDYSSSIEYFSIMFDEFVEITDSTVEIPWKILVNDECPKAQYDIICSVVNEGNMELESSFTLKLNVEYPVLIIDFVEPEQIDGRTENRVTLFGSGFVKGSKFYLDGTELVVDAETEGFISQKSILIPPVSLRGDKLIKVVSANGEEAETVISVVVPDWEAYAIIDKAEIKAGEETVIPVHVDSIDGFEGDAIFEVTNLPEGVVISIPSIHTDTTGNIRITAADDVAPGDYNIILKGTDNGSEIMIALSILEKDVIQVPLIKQIAPYSAFAGTQVTVYGSGFGNNGDLIFNDEVVDVSEWLPGSVTFTVVDGMKSGVLYIRNQNGESNESRLYIHERGFSIRPAVTTVNLSRDVTKTIPVSITGYAEKAMLTLNMDPSSEFEAYLDNDSVIPNGTTNLILKAKDDAVNGTWTVSIIGNCGDYTTSKSVSVTINDRMEIVTSGIYEGKIGIPYKAILETINVEGTVSYSCDASRLPLGLKLTSDGVISGTPADTCSKAFTVTAVDSEGQETQKTVQIVISDNSWASSGKDGGHTRSTTADIPSIEKKAWTAETSKNDIQIVVSENKVFAYGKDEITALSNYGKYKWRNNISIKNIEISGSYIFVLDNEGKLYSIDKTYGNMELMRTDVSNFSTGSSLLLCKGNDGNILIDTVTKDVISIGEITVVDIDKLLWVGRSIYEWNENRFYSIYNGRNSYVCDEEIRSVSGDSYGFVVVTDDSVIELDSNLNEIAKTDSVGIKTDDCVTGLDDRGLFVMKDSVLSEYDRKDLNLIWNKSGVKSFAVANEKAVVITDDAIRVLNRYNGKEIWSEEGKYTSIALYGENIYAETAEGKVISYTGTYNATAPVTEIVFEPSIPNGENGWYTTLPLVSVVSEDKETYVESLMVNYDDNGWSEYEGTKILEEGTRYISAYGIDNKSFRGNTDTKLAYIDVTNPVSSYSITNNADVSDWIDHNVEIELTAEDETSGVAYITVNGKTYSGPITYQDEGVYDFEWYAVDVAGNNEDKHSFKLMIDKFIPTTEHSVKSDKGISVVTLTAYDSGSGVDYIEYSIDGGNYQRYDIPVVLLEAGNHTFEWHAVDISGKSSQMKSIEVHVSKDSEKGNVLALAELNGSRRTAAYPMEYNSMMYKNDFNTWSDIPSDYWSKTYLNTIPRFVLKGEFIQWNGSDIYLNGSKTITYYVKKDAVMYMFTSPDMIPETEWNLIDEHSYIQNAWYADGWKLYMRRAKASEMITVKVEDDMALPLIVVKEEPKVSLDINLKRTDNWDDVYYDGRVPYRKDVQIVLSANIIPENIDDDLPVQKLWTIEMNGEEKTLESLWYDIPLVSEATEVIFRYKIMAMDGKTECICEKKITICPPDDANDLYPWNRR